MPVEVRHGSRRPADAAATRPARPVVLLVLAWLSASGLAVAQSGTLTPVAGLTNQIHYSFAHDFYSPHEYTAPILATTSLDFTFDPLARRLVLRDLHLRSGDVPKWCFDFHVCYDHCAIDIALDPTASPAVAALSDAGHFDLTVPIEMHYQTGYAQTWCDQMPPAVALGSLTMAGTFEHDDVTGATSVTDLTGSGAWVVIGALVTLDVSANVAGATAALGSIVGPLRVGAPVDLAGAGITPGTLLKIFVATSSGAVDVVPDGLAATATSASSWSGELPWPWPAAAPNDALLGNGVVSLELVRADNGYDVSNTRTAVLLGDAAHGVPSITSLNGVSLGPSSTDPTIAVANVETILAPGATLAVGGDGYADALVNVFTAAGNLGPLAPALQTPDSIEVAIPADAPVGPGAIQVVNRADYRASNAVSVPIGSLVTVSSVVVADGVITVTGTGYGDSTVIDLFAFRGGSVINAGGLDAAGIPRIQLTIDGPTELHFTRPPDLDAGPAYATATNPPFIPYTSSGTGPGGRFALP